MLLAVAAVASRMEIGATVHHILCRPCAGRRRLPPCIRLSRSKYFLPWFKRKANIIGAVCSSFPVSQLLTDQAYRTDSADCWHILS
jgi:hypothetical protein